MDFPDFSVIGNLIPDWADKEMSDAELISSVETVKNSKTFHFPSLEVSW